MPIAAFDTNVLFYATGLGKSLTDERKVSLAIALLAEFMTEDVLVVPAQVCLEFHHVLRRKARVSRSEATRIVEEYIDGTMIIPTDFDLVEKAFGLARLHDMQTYDAVILAAAARAGCELLFSEDMQDGFEWEGVRIVNPFA